MCYSFETHTHLCILHRGERERERETCKQGEGAHVLGFIFVLLMHLYRGIFVGFSSPIGFPRINTCLSCDCVSFSDPAYATVVNLDLTLIISTLAYEILTAELSYGILS